MKFTYVIILMKIKVLICSLFIDNNNHDQCHTSKYYNHLFTIKMLCGRIKYSTTFPIFNVLPYKSDTGKSKTKRN